jgi:hypothetical protein
MNRTQVIIQQLGEEVTTKYSESAKALHALSQFLEQYKSVVDDLTKAKSEYADIVSRYSDNSPKLTVSTFPGVAAPTPTYSNSEMQMDSHQLNELGMLISEMEDQKEIIQTQMRKLLGDVNSSIAAMTDTASQVLVFLGQSIDDLSMNGVYGSATLSTI